MKVIGVFSMEDYSISLKRLTFKHSQHFEVEEFSELVFDSISFVQVPTYLSDFEILEGSREDELYIESQMKGFDLYWNMTKVFVLLFGENKYYVVAGRYSLK
jgi:hypothetical protein